MLSANDCQALADKIKAAKTRLHEIAMGDSAREVSSGGDRTAFNQTTIATLKAHIRELEAEYNSGGCAVTLGVDICKPSRSAIKPYF